MIKKFDTFLKEKDAPKKIDENVIVQTTVVQTTVVENPQEEVEANVNEGPIGSSVNCEIGNDNEVKEVEIPTVQDEVIEIEKPEDKTGRKFDEENADDDELIVQDEKLKLFRECLENDMCEIKENYSTPTFENSPYLDRWDKLRLKRNKTIPANIIDEINTAFSTISEVREKESEDYIRETFISDSYKSIKEFFNSLKTDILDDLKREVPDYLKEFIQDDEFVDEVLSEDFDRLLYMTPHNDKYYLFLITDDRDIDLEGNYDATAH